jgi:hypothetical protein
MASAGSMATQETLAAQANVAERPSGDGILLECV